MTLTEMIAMVVWAGAGAIVLFFLMWLDSLFTKYKDLAEMKKGNIAVTTRFIMKLFAQAYILARSITTSNDLLQAILVSFISFVILFVLEMIVELLLKKTASIDLDQGTQQGQIAYALLAGSFHVVGALILAACL